MAVLGEPDSGRSDVFYEFQMSGTVVADGRMWILAHGDVGGARVCISIPLSDWQVAYLGERTDVFQVSRAEREAEREQS